MKDRRRDFIYFAFSFSYEPIYVRMCMYFCNIIMCNGVVVGEQGGHTFTHRQTSAVVVVKLVGLSLPSFID
jgi:hypothetical protein